MLNPIWTDSAKELMEFEAVFGMVIICIVMWSMIFCAYCWLDCFVAWESPAIFGRCCDRSSDDDERSFHMLSLSPRNSLRQPLLLSSIEEDKRGIAMSSFIVQSSDDYLLMV
uniref:Transmembrane protein n=1 Tax=Plectus sambesii TaxID=2011161 RepID=A0A914XEZ7_9BILA